MMKYILICVQNDSATGGAEMVLRMIAEHYLSQGYIVNVFFKHKRILGGWDMENTPSIHLYYTKFTLPRFGTMMCMFEIWKTRKSRYEYAFTSSVADMGVVGLMRILHLVDIRYFIAREATSIFKRFSGSKLRRFKMYYHIGSSTTDLLICQTGYMKEQLLENLPWLEWKTKVQVIPNPVDLRRIAEKAKEELPMPTDSPFIVAAGRFHPVKGFDILIRAFSKLKQANNDLKLVILGDFNSTTALENVGNEIKTLIKELGIEDDVILQGTVDNVYPYFKSARMCVVSSRIEGFPNVLLQEMSQNEKVVSTLCAGYIDKLEGVFTCKTDDVDDLLRAMKECLEADTSKNRELFDRELEKRSIEGFIEKVNTYLIEK
jgi:glycosyltransferase involved in cell wall biosynthesis